MFLEVLFGILRKQESTELELTWPRWSVCLCAYFNKDPPTSPCPPPRRYLLNSIKNEIKNTDQICSISTFDVNVNVNKATKSLNLSRVEC